MKLQIHYPKHPVFGSNLIILVMFLNKITMIFEFLQGKKIQSQIIADFQTKIDLSGLPTGMYYIKLGAKTFKLILSK